MNIKNNESILWQKNIKHYTYKERTIVCNFTNGQWLKISEECFTLLDTFVQDAYTYQEILKVFEDESDRTHIAEVIEKLFAMEALRWSSEKDEGNTIKHFHFNLTDRCNLSPCLLLMDEKYSLGHIDSYEHISHAIETEAYYTVSWKYP